MLITVLSASASSFSASTPYFSCLELTARAFSNSDNWHYNGIAIATIREAKKYCGPDFTTQDCFDNASLEALKSVPVSKRSIALRHQAVALLSSCEAARKYYYIRNW